MLLGAFRVRLAAVLLLPIVRGAFVASYPHGWRFSAPGGGWEYTAFLFVALIVQALLDAGRLRAFRPSPSANPTEAAERVRLS